MRLTEVKQPDSWTKQIDSYTLHRLTKQAMLRMHLFREKMDVLLNEKDRNETWREVTDRHVRWLNGGKHYTLDTDIVTIGDCLIGFEISRGALIEIIGMADTMVPAFNKINRRYREWFRKYTDANRELDLRQRELDRTTKRAKDSL